MANVALKPEVPDFDYAEMLSWSANAAMAMRDLVLAMGTHVTSMDAYSSECAAYDWGALRRRVGLVLGTVD